MGLMSRGLATEAYHIGRSGFSWGRNLRKIAKKHTARARRKKEKRRISEELELVKIEKQVEALSHDRRFYTELMVDGKARRFSPAEAEVAFFHDFDYELEHEYNLQLMNKSKRSDPFYDAWEDWKDDFSEFDLDPLFDPYDRESDIH